MTQTREHFLQKAEENRPVLREEVLSPLGRVTIAKEGGELFVTPAEGELYGEPLGRGDRVIWDFGNHQVGYLTLCLSSIGSPQDSPLYFQLRFLERPSEALENSADYEGWISRSWFQEELLHVDTLPCTLTLPRRYAFRYLELTVLDTSKKWKLVVDSLSVRSVSSAPAKVTPVDGKALLEGLGLWEGEASQKRAELLTRIDAVGLRTLRSCMQDVFEDGPKRDRRLWLGDLHLQALTSYETYRLDSLVRRCLYLFAGLANEEGRVSACVFTEPSPIGDDTYLFDYSLFFGSVLYQHVQRTGDRDLLEDLLPVARRQLRVLEHFFDENGLLTEQAAGRCFVDWKAGLHKQAAGQAIYLYVRKQVDALTELLPSAGEEEPLTLSAEKLTKAALGLFDRDLGVFVSGPDRQVSLASQVWMILAGAVSPGEGRQILARVSQMDAVGMTTPYMHHFYTEALLTAGLQREALEHVEEYWGGMVKEGADTFWEIYDPANPQESPYGSTLITSACHAWSCAPSYLFRRRFGSAR